MTLIAVAALLLATSTVAIAQDTPPVAWPAIHKHVEIMWSTAEPGSAPQFKQFYFDYPAAAMRVDAVSAKNITLTSYWLNTTLYMVFDLYGFLSCQSLEMGFGMPRPDWFVDNSTEMGRLWLTKQWNRSDTDYHHTRWTRKSAQPEGWFDYFSHLASGAPFRMSAPSPLGLVVNEYYSFQQVAGFSKGTFDLPAGVTCNASSSSSVGLSRRVPAALVPQAVFDATMLFIERRDVAVDEEGRRAVRQSAQHMASLAAMAQL